MYNIYQVKWPVTFQFSPMSIFRTWAENSQILHQNATQMVCTAVFRGAPWGDICSESSWIPYVNSMEVVLYTNLTKYEEKNWS